MEQRLGTGVILRLKGVKAVKAKGATYYYHRKTMTRLPGLPGSAEFVAKLRALDARQDPGTAPGTLGGLLALYKASPEYRDLAPGSKREYGKGMKHLGPFLTFPLAVMTTDRLYDLRDRIAGKYSRSTANRTVLFLRLLFTWAKKRQKWRDNPALDVDLIRRPKDAPLVNRRWRDDEIELVLERAPEWMRVPIALAVYTGLRACDVVRVTWRAYDGSAFETRQWKTGRPVWVPAHYRLRKLLDATPRRSPNIVVGMRGRPMSENSLGSRFFDFLAEMKAEGLIETGLSFHGLRHTCGTRLAEAGMDPAGIAAVLGHEGPRSTERYTRTADRRRLASAAVARIEEHDRNAERKTERKTGQ